MMRMDKYRHAGTGERFLEPDGGAFITTAPEARTSLPAFGRHYPDAAGIHSREEPTSNDVDYRNLEFAFRVVGQQQRIDFQLDRHSLRGGNDQQLVHDICAASGVRYRMIKLREKWWHQNHGPLLAFVPQSSSGRVVAIALIPQAAGYCYVDASTGQRQTVNAGIASRMASYAFMFYCPLPQRQLSKGDFFRFGFQGQGRDWFTLISAAVCSTLLSTAMPLITRLMINSATSESNNRGLVQAGLALAISALAITLLDIGRALALLRLRTKLAVSEQAALWDRILALPLSFFRRFSTGDLARRATAVDRIEALITADITSATFTLLSGLSCLVVLLFCSVQLALIALLDVLLLGSLMVILGRRQMTIARVAHDLDVKVLSFVYSIIAGINKLRVAGAENKAFAQWTKRFALHRQRAIGIRRLSNTQSLLAVIHGTVLWIMVSIIAAFAKKAPMTIGDYVAFNITFAQLQTAIMAVIAMIPDLITILLASERMQPILSAVPESAAIPAIAPSQLVITGRLELRNVSFRYPESRPILRNVSLKAEAGQFVALVGPSGSGKSTCLRLMLGFDPTESGSILLDGREIGSLDMRLVRRQFGVVKQNGTPLVGTIFQNISGNLPLTWQEVWEAARFVGLEEEIRNMPMGMFTAVNHRGACFSGGEKQRLLLARAIIRRPRILFLDEATSALDNPTQDLIMRNLEQLKVTRVVVAHRLSTVRRADCIYVLERGEIVEQGSFEELLAMGGRFSRNVECQKEQ